MPIYQTTSYTFDSDDPSAYRAAFTEKTKALYVEIIGNPPPFTFSTTDHGHNHACTPSSDAA